METLYRKTFYSWTEEGAVMVKRDGKYEYVKDQVRAVALCDGTWFMRAINALRDGDMGEKDENGVYDRIWYGDDIYNSYVKEVRPANIHEVNTYLKYCKLVDEAEEDGRELVAIIYGQDRTDAIFKDIKK